MRMELNTLIRRLGNYATVDAFKDGTTQRGFILYQWAKQGFDVVQKAHECGWKDYWCSVLVDYQVGHAVWDVGYAVSQHPRARVPDYLWQEWRRWRRKTNG